MTKILSILNSTATHNLQECYEEFESTSKVDLMQNRESLSKSFENLHKNLDSLYRNDAHLIELFARIYYEVNCKFEFKCIYDFLRRQNHTNEWIDFAKNVIDNPSEFRVHFENLANLYDEQNISDINEEFIYLYLKYFEKLRNQSLLQSLWQNCDERSHLATYLVEILQNLPNDYIATRNALLQAFDSESKAIAQNIKITIESSDYATSLRQIHHINFDKILAYCKANKTKCDLERDLGRGKKILQDSNELICYLGIYGLMHQIKLNASFKVLCNVVNLNDKNINIIDYGCGQALASCVLLDFINNHNLNAKINHIILIEPSSVALSRGILHLNLLGISENQIIAFNKSLDDIKIRDLALMGQNITLHIFSNVLDLTNFRLDRAFYDKISSANKGQNIFICVSPPYNNTQVRLDLFYQHFKENYNAELISHNKNDIFDSKYHRAIKRYEYIFQCNL